MVMTFAKDALIILSSICLQKYDNVKSDKIEKDKSSVQKVKIITLSVVKLCGM